MVQPNPPRFLREGDMLEFTVKVTNLGGYAAVRARAPDVRRRGHRGGRWTPRWASGTSEQAFDVPAKQSRTFSWTVHVPDDMGPLTYKAVAASAKLSDGEEGLLPVLSRRILVTESLPLPIRGRPDPKTFDFERLLHSGPSKHAAAASRSRCRWSRTRRGTRSWRCLT